MNTVIFIIVFVKIRKKKNIDFKVTFLPVVC